MRVVDRGPAGARAELEHRDVGLRVLLVEDGDARGHGPAGVIGLSTVTVTGTELPFSTRGGMSRRTRPGQDRALAR